MKGLVILYWGTVFLMYLSQTYYRVQQPLSGFRAGKHNFMWARADIFMVLVIAWMTCFSFLRTSYNDTDLYIATFLEAPPLSEALETGFLTDLTGNPLSLLYRYAMREVTDNYHVYFFFPAFLSSFAVIKLFKQYSVDPAMSLMIFFSIGTYVMYIAALKQCLAMFFLLLALPYALDRKYFRFFLLCFIAILFHTHAFMFLALPLLNGKPWGKRTWMLLGAVFFAMATYDVTLGAFMEYAQSIGATVAEIEVFDDHQINILRVLVYWIPALFALIFREQLFADSTNEEHIFMNMSILSAFILTIGLVQGANLFARMAAYFEIATAISLPWMLKKLFDKRSENLVTLIACICYFGYFFYEFSMAKDFSSSYASISLFQFLRSLFP